MVYSYSWHARVNRATCEGYDKHWEDSEGDYLDFPEAKEAAEKWLDINYPDWKNPLAYWD